ncbi:MAG TPA: hypothetical protein PK280_02035 [Planctomycetota bacterium]|nr:hypothetical protein [Planctomycetota bacterium]
MLGAATAACAGLLLTAAAAGAEPSVPPPATAPAPAAAAAPADPGGAEAGKAAEEEKDWSVSAEVSVYGKYVYRGCNLFDDAVLVPSATVEWRGLSLSVCGYLELTNEAGHSGNFTEVDTTLAYTRTIGLVVLGAGVSCYNYPHTDADGTVELYASVGLELPLEPTVTVYRDVDEIEGAYGMLSLSHAFEDLWKPFEGASVGLELSASVGYGNDLHNLDYYGTEEEGLADATFGARLPVSVGDHLTVAPSLWYSTLLDDEVRRAARKDDNLWAGITVGFSF